MQNVNEKWLKIANIYYALFAASFLGLFCYFAYQQQTVDIQIERYGLSQLTAIAASVTIVYCLSLLFLVKKYNIWLAYTAGFALYGILVSVLTEQSIGSGGELVFLGILVSVSLLSALYGPVAVLSVIGLISIIYAMEIGGSIDPTSLGVQKDGLLSLIRILIPIFLVILFRKYYVTEISDKTNYIEKYLVNNEVVRLLTDSLRDGVIILDKDEVIRSINPSAVKILNQEAKDMLDLNYRSVLKFKESDGSQIPQEKEPIAAALQEKRSVHQELLLPGKGEDIYIDVSVSVISNEETGDTYGAIVILRDISKKKREEAAKSEFISTASHEMRTPVAAIEGYLALALNPNVTKIDEKTKSFLQKAYASTQHLGQLFQDLLISTRAEDGRLVSHPEVIEIGEILERQAEYFTAVAQKKGLGLDFVVGTQSNQTKHDNNVRPLFYSYADPARIQEVTSNLIDNAIKYTPSGKITIGLTGNKEVVQFFIRDTGLGISQEDIPHLFQKFYRVDSSATRTTGGTGLGLFICRKIIELYKGRIWVQSKKGEGSTFYINLPRLERAQAEAIKLHDAKQKEST